jgi:hypothetical protein
LDLGDFSKKKSRITMQVVFMCFLVLINIDITMVNMILLDSKFYHASSILIPIILNIIILFLVNVPILVTLKRIKNFRDYEFFISTK